MSHATSQRFPALYEYATKKLYPLGPNESFDVGRAQAAHLPLLDRTCSARQFRIVRRGSLHHLEPLSAQVPTHCNGQIVQGTITLAHGAVIQAGASSFCYLEREESLRTPAPIYPQAQSPSRQASPPTESRPSSRPPAPDRRAKTSIGQPQPLGAIPAPPSAPQPSPPPVVGRGDRTMIGPAGGSERAMLEGRIRLSGQMLIGRDVERVQVPLEHAQVSRIHAQITLQQGWAIITDLNSSNGTFVNGRRITVPTTVRAGDRINIGPYCLVFDGTGLVSSSRSNNVELVCRNLKRVVRDRATGQPATLLDDVTLVIRPKEFVCILGPSGSGKTTLLNALSARVPADAGCVTINGEDFYGVFDALKQDVAVVPQREALHELLTVQSALSYTAKLRLPPDTSDGERLQAIEKVLGTVGLLDRRSTKIEYLSGGQQKRASLANEIVSSPSLLFLDEVTSGLDEQTDGELMRLFRQIADGGKTVVCVTHSLANVERNCHLVVILAPGGKLAFVGTPAEARQYFRVDRLGDVYERLAEKSPDEWKQAFQGHGLYSKYIDTRLPVDNDRDATTVPPYKPTPRERLQIFWHQTQVLTRRYLSVQFADWRFAAMMLGQSLLVAFLLVVFFGDINRFDESPRVITKSGPLGQPIYERPDVTKARSSSQLLFLLAISCLWLGCNNAAKEIVKERPIYTRERDINLLVPSYYASKLILLGGVSLLQASLLLFVVKIFCSLPGNAFAEWIFLLMLSFAGVTLGLLISSFAKTNDVAVSIIPAVLIPQIILAGVISPVEGFARILARLFITGYWGYQGLVALLPTDLLERLPSDDCSAFGAFCVVLLHILIFGGGALAVLYFRDMTRPTREAMLKKLLAKGRQPTA